MEKNYSIISDAIKKYLEAKKKLQECINAKTERQISSEIGEWFVMEVYDGQKAESKIQRDWDIITKDGKKIQVKTHAKHETNDNRWTKIQYGIDADIDELIIIIFSPSLSIDEFYRISWMEVQQYIRVVKNGVRCVYWNQLSNFKLKLEDLPKQEVVQLFIPIRPEL